VFIVFLLFSESVYASHYQYTVEFDDSLVSAKIKLCLDGEQDNYLEIDRFIAYETLIQKPKTNKKMVGIEGRFWNIKEFAKNTCLNYEVSFKDNRLKTDPKRYAFKNGSANQEIDKKIIHVEENNWLWLPEKRGYSDIIEIEFHIPENYKISTPWHRLDFEKNRYRLGYEPQEWGYHLIIGEIDLSIITIGKNRILNIATINASSQASSTTQSINNWLENIAKSIKYYLGQFPLKQMQIIVYPQPGIKRSPVPWGEVSRGNGLGILFVIRSDHDIKDFYSDWTASHEFAHSILPKLRYPDIWLSEGLASYLQYVLMAQNKQLTTEQAWRRIYKGLQKGLKGTQLVSKEKLLDVSNNRKTGPRSGRTMRIYWSGAAYFLKADIKLRAESNGKVGLSDILLKLSNCCLKGKKVWIGDALASKLDELSDTNLFSILYKNMAYSSAFPKFNKEFEMLGFQVTDNSIELGEFKENQLSKTIMTASNKTRNQN